jgi:hypothetical protein
MAVRSYPTERVQRGIDRFLDLFRTTPDDPEVPDSICPTCRTRPAVIDGQCFTCARRGDTC